MTSEEQNSGMDQLNFLSQTNASLSSDLASSAEKLNKQPEDMKSVLTAIGDSTLVKQKLYFKNR